MPSLGPRHLATVYLAGIPAGHPARARLPVHAINIGMAAPAAAFPQTVMWPVALVTQEAGKGDQENFKRRAART